MAGGISLDISWAGRSAADFARVFAATAQIDDFKSMFENIANDVVSPSIAANFAEEGRPTGWTPLAQSTIERKSAAGYSSPTRILYATGALEQAATDVRRYIINRSELRVAPFGVDYWTYHQVGDGVPQRVYLMLQERDRTKINSLMADEIRKYMNFNPATGGRVFTGGTR